MGYRALTIAKWFAAWAEAEEADCSNLKVQKLLYYAQGHHLATFGRALFTDDVQAWAHGPVVPDVYHEFKRFGSGDVVLADDPFDFDEVDEDTTQFLIHVWDAYAPYSAWRLRNMTHEDAPWIEAFSESSWNSTIGEDALRRFFERRPALV